MNFTTLKTNYRNICKNSTDDNPNIIFMEQNLPNMTITTNKELSDSVLYALWWFSENGFQVELRTYNTSKAVFYVTKDGVDDLFELTSTKQDPKKCDIVSYMEQFGKCFAMKQEIERLKALKNS